MKTKSLTNSLGIWAIIVATILAIPFLTQAPWSQGDYILAGSILFAAASIYEFSTRNLKQRNYKIIVALAILAVLVLIQYWAVSGPD